MSVLDAYKIAYVNRLLYLQGYSSRILNLLIEFML